MTIPEIQAKIDANIRDSFNGSVSAEQIHEILTDILTMPQSESGDGFVIPKGVIMTIENEYQFVVPNTLKVAGTIVVKGDLIIN